ncbi:hypothetical protein ACJJIQ_05240 [Microbulbifer sp. ANSA003]|uniref:hypothetical protein n=1 Tax=Microbulbifer sp. ANSA003 TaxID=3243360 RepID=UPI0040426CFF
MKLKPVKELGNISKVDMIQNVSRDTLETVSIRDVDTLLEKNRWVANRKNHVDAAIEKTALTYTHL